MIKLYQTSFSGKIGLILILKNQDTPPLSWVISPNANPATTLTSTGWKEDGIAYPYVHNLNAPDGELHLLIPHTEAAYIDSGLFEVTLFFPDNEKSAYQFRVFTNIPFWDGLYQPSADTNTASTKRELEPEEPSSPSLPEEIDNGDEINKPDEPPITKANMRGEEKTDEIEGIPEKRQWTKALVWIVVWILLIASMSGYWYYAQQDAEAALAEAAAKVEAAAQAAAAADEAAAEAKALAVAQAALAEAAAKAEAEARAAAEAAAAQAELDAQAAAEAALAEAAAKAEAEARAAAEAAAAQAELDAQAAAEAEFQDLTIELEIEACRSGIYPPRIAPPLPPIACFDELTPINRSGLKFRGYPLRNDIPSARGEVVSLVGCDQPDFGTVTIVGKSVVFEMSEQDQRPEYRSVIFDCTIQNPDGIKNSGIAYVFIPASGNYSVMSSSQLADFSGDFDNIYLLNDGRFHRILSAQNAPDSAVRRLVLEDQIVADVTVRARSTGPEVQSIRFRTGLQLEFALNQNITIAALPEAPVTPLQIGDRLQNGGSFLNKFKPQDKFFNWLTDRWDSDNLTFTVSRHGNPTLVNIPTSLFRAADQGFIQ